MALAAAALAGPALAEPDLFSRGTLSGVLDLRAAAADGEPSWVDGGFGKARFGDEAALLADGVVEWRPKLSWSLSAVVDLALQSDQDRPVDLNEAYLLYKPLGSAGLRVQARAGLFYPPISLEHDGRAWSTSRTITPSAINSWIGEELFGAGAEVKASGHLGGHEVALTAGAVGANDTAGTLLTFRGWSLNDVRATLNGEHRLPPMSSFAAGVQWPGTYPVRELDDRYGYYVRADWRPPAAVALNLVYYDNLGDMVGVDDELQWSWYTRFIAGGLSWTPTDDVEVLAQGMKGVTRMGYTSPAGRWFDAKFDSAYLLATRTAGPNAVTGRLDYFRVDNEAAAFYGDVDETGWAATAAYRRDISPRMQIFLEALHVESDRPSRALAGEASRQSQTTVQAMTRLSF